MSALVYSAGPSPVQVGLMQSSVDELRRMVLQVADVARKSSFGEWLLNGGTSVDAAKTLVAKMTTAIDSLDARRQKVLSNLETFENWAKSANEYRRVLAAQLNDQSTWGLSSYLASVAKGTAQDTAVVAGKAADAAKFGLPLIAVIVVGLVVLRVWR